MEILKSILLGVIQGATEFLPVSSSGHLVIIPFILKWDYIPVYYTVLLHLATLFSLITVFYREIGRLIKFFFKGIFIKSAREDNYFKLAILIIIGSIPAMIVGFLINDFIEGFFSRPLYVAFFLLITAAFLITGEIVGRKFESVTPKGFLDGNISGRSYSIALFIGIGQAIAIFPGISRSGSTISFARFFGIKREECVRFSFLLSIPVILGAFIFEMSDSFQSFAGQDNFTYINIVISFIFSYITGLLAIKFLVKLSQRRNLNIFAVYCIVIAAVIFILLMIR